MTVTGERTATSMRRWLAGLLAVAVAAALAAGCGGDDATDAGDGGASTETEAPGADDDNADDTDDNDGATDDTDDNETTGDDDEPSCDVTGTFTSDEAGHTDEAISLEGIGATELPTYELDGSDGMSHWEAYSRSAQGSRGPVISYVVAFYDGEVGYRVELKVFTEDANESTLEVRRFTDTLVMSTESDDTITWGTEFDARQLDELATDGSGGTVSFLTTRGGSGGDEYFYPLRVELAFDCPPEAIQE